MSVVGLTYLWLQDEGRTPQEIQADLTTHDGLIENMNLPRWIFAPQNRHTMHRGLRHKLRILWGFFQLNQGRNQLEANPVERRNASSQVEMSNQPRSSWRWVVH